MKSHPSELTLGWNGIKRPGISALADEINVTLGRASFEQESPDVCTISVGEPFYTRRWAFTAEHLPKVASWFDRLPKPVITHDLTAYCNISWFFAWRDEPLPLPPLHKFVGPGGHFMISLGSPHRITTQFSFRTIDKYDEIKQYFESIGLAKLSDRHLTPKAEMRRLGRVS